MLSFKIISSDSSKMKKKGKEKKEKVALLYRDNQFFLDIFKSGEM